MGDRAAEGYFLDHDVDENTWHLYFRGYPQATKSGGPTSPNGVYESAPNIQATHEIVSRHARGGS